jgi:hypothetical protein
MAATCMYGEVTIQHGQHAVSEFNICNIAAGAAVEPFSVTAAATAVFQNMLSSAAC